MKTKLSLFLLCACFLLRAASAGHRVVTHSSVQFTIRNAGLEVTGTIGGISAEIAFQPDQLDQSYITATALPATLCTGISVRDKHLQRADYFDVKKYPQIHLASRGFRKKAKDRFLGQFDLTIKGITRPIVVPFTASAKNNTIFYRGSFEINRLDFNLGEKSAILDEKVKVVIEVQAVPMN